MLNVAGLLCNTFLATLEARHNDSLSPLSRLITLLSRWKIFNEEVDIVYFQFQPRESWTAGTKLVPDNYFSNYTSNFFISNSLMGRKIVSAGGFIMIIDILPSTQAVMLIVNNLVLNTLYTTISKAFV